MSPLDPPVPLTDRHDLTAFDSGVSELDDWLRRRARRNEIGGASRTFVVCETGSSQVIAYYSLATGGVQHDQAPGSVRRNMPEPIPVIVLGRLAVDRRWRQRGIGRGLLRDAVLRTLLAAEHAGVRALLVHALSDDARRFYENSGFRPSPLNPYTLMLLLNEARRTLGL